MKIIARKTGRCAYPPIGGYIGTPPTAKSFEQHEIKDNNFVPGMQLRPDGVRQPYAEAAILGNIRAIDQGRGSLNGDIMTSAWR
jgi:hypothetical protein